MPRPIEPPRLRFWRGAWYLFCTDRLRRKPVRLRCDRHDAHTPEQRQGMLKDYRERDRRALAEMVYMGGVADYDRNLVEAVNWFLADVDARELTRAKAGGREGIAATTAERLRDTVTAFRDWLPPHTATGNLDGHALARFVAAVTPGRATATVNAYRRNVKACLRWLMQRRPRLFPDPDIFWPALKLVSWQPKAAVAYTPAQLRAFHRALIPHQRRLFLLLALTGMRLGEVLALRWGHVDLHRGRITIVASKTGRTRILPFIGAPEGDVAPRLLRALRRWPMGDTVCGTDHVSRKGWRTAARKAGVEITPQGLRRNFTSYAASLGIPPAVVAMWQGHGLAVAERHYRQQVLDRHAAASIEAAMGLSNTS